MISYEGNIKLLDFGVAKGAQRTAESTSGTVKGKVAYLSPEQCESTTIDRRSDLFALGIVLHEMLTGRRLFDRETDFNAMLAITTEDVAPPSATRPEVPRAVDALVMKALARSPDARFATAAEMLGVLEEIAARERLSLSGTAMGRFLRETFGDKQEPWVELRRDTERHVVVTTQHFAVEPVVDPRRSSQLLAELYETPELRPTRPLRAAEPSEAITAVRSAQPEHRDRDRRWLAAVAAGIVTAASAVTLVLVIGGDRGEPASAPVDAATVVRATPTPDAPLAIVDAPPRDEPVVDDVTATLKWCAARRADELAPDERTRCGIAACKQGHEPAAIAFYALASGPGRLEIERTCRANRIVLGAPRAKPAATRPRPKVDPCEANPLKCRQ
jgi:hypothetical protein